MKEMAQGILRFEPTLPDSVELCACLRQAGVMLAASDLESPARIKVLRRARALIYAALSGTDRLVRHLDRAVARPIADQDTVPYPIADQNTDAHDLSKLEIPTLVRVPERR